MAAIRSFELFLLDIPFKHSFKHAAASRKTSSSIFLKCTVESGDGADSPGVHYGYGECLPRSYVTGETRDGAFKLLQDTLLPALLGMEFDSLSQLISFLSECNGKAPVDWLDPETPQTAAWAAVDLALLDGFGRAFAEPVKLTNNALPADNIRYSAVLSAERGWKAIKMALVYRLYGFRQAKLKVEKRDAVEAAGFCRRLLGSKFDIRVDANMAWEIDEAVEVMQELAKFGIRSFEQPTEAEDIGGLARLVNETGLEVMVDESLNDAESLEKLIEQEACTSVNVRISKCGGLVAAFNRCKRAIEAGMIIQVGAQVGETSLLSSAQLILLAAVPEVRYAEGCFGLHLLHEDPVSPLKQFGYGGSLPPMPAGPGFGIEVDEGMLRRYSRKTVEVK